MGLTCLNCGNDKNFPVKTLQLHLLQLEKTGIDTSEGGLPAVVEILSDECATEVELQGLATRSASRDLANVRRPLRPSQNPNINLSCISMSDFH